MSLKSLIRGNRAPAFAIATIAIPAIHGEVARPEMDVLALLAEAGMDMPGLTAGQYLALLSPDDIEGIQAGETGLATLKVYAPCFAEGMASGRLTVPEPVEMAEEQRDSSGLRGHMDGRSVTPR